MDPIIVRRVLGRLRAPSVVLAIALLTAGASGQVAAAVPSFVPPSPAEAAGPMVPSVVLGIAPGMVAELVDDPDLVALLAASVAADLLPDPVRTTGPVPEPTATGMLRPTEPSRPTRSAPPIRDHRGRNHVWSASFGLDRAVSWYSCSSSRFPDYLVYRWGCAGRNNVYLFAHAGGPFRRLHDLYARGRLHKGMAVTYADANGHVHRYNVAWWRVVLPTNGEFAYAGQSRPSMTLQTCVGPNDRYRLVVRLYQTD